MKGLSVAAREFQRGAESVADGEAKKGTVSAVEDGRIEVRCDGQR
jgi:acylphosphatase